MAEDKPKKIVLKYFPFPGRAEPIRLALKLAKLEFEEVNVTFPEFEKTRDDFVFGRVPTVIVDDKVEIGQSNAALAYFGRFGGLYPTDPHNNMRVIEVMDLIEDGYTILFPSVFEQDQAKTLEMRKALIAEGGRLRQYLFYFNRYLERNEGETFFVGKSLTVADLKAVVLLRWFSSGSLDGIDKSLVDSFPALSQRVKTVEEALKAAGV